MTTCGAPVSIGLQSGYRYQTPGYHPKAIGHSYGTCTETGLVPKVLSLCHQTTPCRSKAVYGCKRLHSHFLPSYLFGTAQPQQRSRLASRRYQKLVCAAALEESEGAEAPPAEGWERDAAAARVAELAEKAGGESAASGRGAAKKESSKRRLSFRAVTKAAESAHRGGVNGASDENQGGQNEASAAPRRFESQNGGGDFERGPQRRESAQQSPSGEVSLVGNTRPWVRKGSEAAKRFAEESAFWQERQSGTRGGWEEERQGRYGKDSDNDNEDASLEEWRASRSFDQANQTSGYGSDRQSKDRREDKRDFSRNGQMDGGYGRADDRRGESKRGRSDRSADWGDQGWSENDTRKAEIKPPPPRSVWRSQSAGEEVLGTKAFVARERGENAFQGGSFQRRSGGGDPRGNRREMGMRKWDERDEEHDWKEDADSGEESGQEISSWAPKGNTRKSGAEGRMADGRGSSRGAEDGPSRNFSGGVNSAARSTPREPFSFEEGRSQTFRRRSPGSQEAYVPDNISRGFRDRGVEREGAQPPRSAEDRFTDAPRSFQERGVEREPIKPTSAEERRERKKRQNVKLEGPGCYGCGARLQVSQPGGPGYLRPDLFELKRVHRQLGETLCARCCELSHGKMVPAVGGNGGHGSGGQQEGFVTAEDLREQLKPLRYNKVLVVKLVDIADFNGSFLSKVRDLVGANPIILVCTKVDLLPAGTDLEAVADWVWEATVRKKLKPISVHLISSLKKAGLPSLAANILRERQGRDVYVLGAANVGKSAFINGLLGEMATRDPAAAAAQRRRPTESAMPGTTLGPIPINAFSGGGELMDTPGIHLHHRLASLLTPDELAVLSYSKRLQPVSPGISIRDRDPKEDEERPSLDDVTPPLNEKEESDDPPSSSAPPLIPGDFVILKPHPGSPQEALFVAQVSHTTPRVRARAFVPKLLARGNRTEPWVDTWERRWVPYEGGDFELSKDDVIVSWTSKARNVSSEGVPIPPGIAARAQEMLEQYQGGDSPALKYPSWVKPNGAIMSAEEWNEKSAVGGAEAIETRGDTAGIQGTTYFWGGVARVDVLEAPPGLRLFFYGPRRVAVHAVATAEADDYYQDNLFETLTPPSNNRGAPWDGLPYKKECKLFSESDVRPAGDVVVSGLGWFAVGGAPGPRGRRTGQEATGRGEVRLLVHTPRGVEVYLRPPMPVTETGADWYERPDLDVELERPPIYYPREEMALK